MRSRGNIGRRDGKLGSGCASPNSGSKTLSEERLRRRHSLRSPSRTVGIGGSQPNAVTSAPAWLSLDRRSNPKCADGASGAPAGGVPPEPGPTSDSPPRSAEAVQTVDIDQERPRLKPAPRIMAATDPDIGSDSSGRAGQAGWRIPRRSRSAETSARRIAARAKHDMTAGSLSRSLRSGSFAGHVRPGGVRDDDQRHDQSGDQGSAQTGHKHALDERFERRPFARLHGWAPICVGRGSSAPKQRSPHWPNAEPAGTSWDGPDGRLTSCGSFDSVFFWPLPRGSSANGSSARRCDD